MALQSYVFDLCSNYSLSQLLEQPYSASSESMIQLFLSQEYSLLWSVNSDT